MLQKSIRIMFVIIATVVAAPFSYAIDLTGTNITQYIEYINANIASEYNNQNMYTQSLQVLKQLCTNIYSTKTDDILYDPRQSIFATIVCNSLAQWGKDEKLQEKIKNETIYPYLKRINWHDLTIFCPKAQNTIQSNGECMPEERNNSMDYNYAFLKIIKHTLNDRSNIQTIRLYGLEKIDDKNNDLANAYLATKFNAIGKIPEEKDYPKTYQALKQYIDGTKDIINKLYLIDHKKTKDASDDIWSKKYCIRNNMFFTIGWKKIEWEDCNSKKDYSDHTSYINAMYNEIFFYTLFSSFYEQYLPIFLEKKSPDEPNAIKQFLTQVEKTIFIQKQAQEHRLEINNATKITIKQLWNLQASFPLHIWLLLYQEDLYDFRKRLAKIYLPFHQLHYKLENVQSKE